MRSIIGSLLNRAPVNYARDAIFSPVFSPSRNQRTKELSTMEVQSTVFAIVDRISSTVAANEWNLYRGGEVAATPSQEDPAAIVSTHPALSVLNNPNPHYSRSRLFESIQQHYELTGEARLIAVRPKGLDSAPPIELWPIRPDRLRPIPHPTEFISGWLYKAGMHEVRLSDDEVMPMSRPDPLDPYSGIGPLGALQLDIEGEHSAAEWNAAFFRNGAEPGGVIELDEESPLDDPEFDKLQEHWNLQHKGANNAHRVAIVEMGQWKERKMSFRDMQFEQLRRFTKAQIMAAWTFPKPLIGDVEDVNRANADAGIAIFAEGLLVPRLNRWRELLNREFLPFYRKGGRPQYHFNYADPVPLNKQQEGQNQRLQALNVASFVDKGFDPAGVLEAFGFPAIEWLGPPKDRFALAHPPEPVAETPDFGEQEG
tara:strand:+ start:975 stop:2252 length:1278 start_codon:yes stop_codon:yes gene_type:complete